MSLAKFHLTVITGWLVVVAATYAGSVALGTTPTLVQGIAWLLVASLPALILLLVFRGAPPPTISEVLYEAEHPAHVIQKNAAVGRPGNNVPRL